MVFKRRYTLRMRLTAVDYIFSAHDTIIFQHGPVLSFGYYNRSYSDATLAIFYRAQRDKQIYHMYVYVYTHTRYLEKPLFEIRKGIAFPRGIFALSVRGKLARQNFHGFDIWNTFLILSSRDPKFVHLSPNTVSHRCENSIDEINRIMLLHMCSHPFLFNVILK